MKYKIILFVILVFNFCFSQTNDKTGFFQFEYTSVNYISINNNNYTTQFEDTKDNTMSLAFELNTIHGLFFTKYTSLGAGIGLDWNINKTYLINPLFLDFRLYFSPFGEPNTFYAYTQMGKNINWNSNFSAGNFVKAGLGITLDGSAKHSYIVELFIKSKISELEELEKFNTTYSVNSYGVSLGIKF